MPTISNELTNRIRRIHDDGGVTWSEIENTLHQPVYIESRNS